MRQPARIDPSRPVRTGSSAALAAAIGVCAWLALATATTHAQATESAPASRTSETLAAPSEATPSSSAPAKAPSQALEHYQRGREHYLAGRYREALEELQAALALDPDSPNLIYNVARVHEDLGNLDEAIRNYQHYLEVLPSGASAEREKTELTIRRLRGAKVEVAARHSEAPALLSFEPETRPRRALGKADWLFWMSAGGGLALLGGGGVCGLLALGKNNETSKFVVGADGTLAQRKRLVSQTQHLALASDLLVVGGAAALTGAALLFFMRRGPIEDASRPAHASLYFDGKHAGLALSGSF